MDKKNRVALVTDGSRNLGKEMAWQLAEKGIEVILTYNRQAQEAQNVVTQIEKGAQEATTIQLNTGAINPNHG